MYNYTYFQKNIKEPEFDKEYFQKYILFMFVWLQFYPKFSQKIQIFHPKNRHFGHFFDEIQVLKDFSSNRILTRISESMIFLRLNTGF